MSNIYGSTKNHVVNFWKIIPCLTTRIWNNDISNKTRRIYKPGNFDSLYSFFSECDWIVDNIYLGSAYSAVNSEVISKFSITSIANITKDIPNFYPEEIEYLNIKLDDNGKDDISLYQLNQCIEFIKKSSGNVLIHCLAGRSRSVTVILYYLIKEKKMTLNEALTLIKKKTNLY